ncbi:M56 family metallopeptidase [Streptomyces profundus]|uniref:M56 family metallopeptidase n=1 Tax=Streptomyces profundus TaxID=2867410 RepID=UPI001D164DC9|nr:M56 family metallopeptidase [Streptomyces sp. MA3_2.13]UED87547.1 M56 family metallopeptidase [Streptomyces sp. MA3_2.13]
MTPGTGLPLLTLLALVACFPAPGALARADWPGRAPILALWTWQCLLGAALLSLLGALLLGSAVVLADLPAPAPAALGSTGPDAASLWLAPVVTLLAAGALWTVRHLAGELRQARRRDRGQRAYVAERVPALPPGLGVGPQPLLVLEDEYPDAWRVPGRPYRLVVTTGAMRRLTPGQLDAVLRHERHHVRARHHWLLRVAAAFGAAFPRVPLFSTFCAQTHRLVEYAADDDAARPHGHLTTALALVALNRHRGVLTCSPDRARLGDRVHRLLNPGDRIGSPQRALITATSLLLPTLAPLTTAAVLL